MLHEFITFLLLVGKEDEALKEDNNMGAMQWERFFTENSYLFSTARLS